MLAEPYFEELPARRAHQEIFDFYSREVPGRPGLCFVLSPAPQPLPAR